MTSWEILIPTIPHRHDKLVRLLDTLAPQIRRGVSVIVYRDNLEVGFGAKCQALAEASTAEYTSHLNDDDGVSPDFVARVWDALKCKPDYVGFRVRYTEDGALQQPIVHSLAHPDWGNTPTMIYRDITHLNPIRRDIARQATFHGHQVTDRDWADAIRATGLVRRQAFIDAEVYYYQHEMGDFILTQRAPMPSEQIPALPEYPFVRYIDGKD